MEINDQQIGALEALVTTKADAALRYFLEVTRALEVLTDGLNTTADASDRIGRPFLKINMTTQEISSASGHHTTKLASLIGKGVLAVNAVQPGEFSTEISYDAPTLEVKNLRWQFPQEAVPTPRQFAEKIARELISPTDGPMG